MPGHRLPKIESLATCAWVREQQTILFQGPPGTGKTHLSAALGVKAIENGFTVVFYQLQDLLPLLKKDADLAPQRLRAKKYMKANLRNYSLSPLTANSLFQVSKHNPLGIRILVQSARG